MNNITALQALYAALGGTPTNVANMTTIPELIGAIAALIAAGDFGILPSVAAADNGKVLTVANGAWSAVTPTPELPAVTAEDNGDVLTVVEGVWAPKTPE